MYIIGRVTLSSQNRVTIGAFIAKDKLPKKFTLAINGQEQIELFREGRGDGLGVTVPVDEKGRITIPKWIVDELGEYKDLFFITDKNGQRLFLSPKTGNVL